MIKHKLKVSLWEAQGRACYICDKTLAEPKPNAGHADDAPTKDHVVPRAHGGGLYLLAHRKCNNEKGDRPPTERELLRIETTLANLDRRALAVLLESVVSQVTQTKKRVALLRSQTAEAERALMVVLRYAPTELAAQALARLSRAT